VAGKGPFAMNAAFIFATIAGSEHVEARVFDEEEEAFFWLREQRP
jgi:hypothetical protein